MHAKYLRRDFGSCPRYFCDNYPVLPVGLNDALGVARVSTYCPRCRQVFRASEHVDGASFGTTFPHLFLMTFGFPRVSEDDPLQSETYVPRVFGFRLHSSASHRAGQGAVPTTSVLGGCVQQRRRQGTGAVISRKRPRLANDDDDESDLEDPAVAPAGRRHARSWHHDFGAVANHVLVNQHLQPRPSGGGAQTTRPR
mmetsp:Transcript_27703/g.84987  ORF Transcript_27703/g.84987 Transcript_27703/m.84987 type:complete len:197 (+) Transcript_27703:262-852(+)